MAFLLAFIHRQFLSEPPVPTASFKGRVVLVTGANSGLGKEACRCMIQLGVEKIILACRDVEKGHAAVKDLQQTTGCAPDRLQVWRLDMSSSYSVETFAGKVRAELPRLDALVANAGIGTRQYRVTPQGDEETVMANVVSTALLALLLHPKLHETAQKFKTQTHVTITGSELYEVAAFTESKAPKGQLFEWLSDKNHANIGDRYNTSKLLALCFAREFAKRSPTDQNVIVNVNAPGLHREFQGWFLTTLIKILARRSEVGARALVYGASAGMETHGQYIPDCKITQPKGPLAGLPGAELQARVWEELAAKLEHIKPGVTKLAPK